MIPHRNSENYVAPAIVRASPSTNKYENTVIIARRAKQIASHQREKFYNELENADLLDMSDESVRSNLRQRQRIARKYQRMDKPVLMAKHACTAEELIYSYMEAGEA